MNKFHFFIKKQIKLFFNQSKKQKKKKERERVRNIYF